jgi:hypothetical protein
VLRALAAQGLVYEPDFTREMMDALGTPDQEALFGRVGFGPNREVAVESLASFGWPVRCIALAVPDEVREATHAMLTGAADA